jgi:hypothetical protein
MCDPEEIDNLYQRLAIHRKRLRIILAQHAQFGPAYVPTLVSLEISVTRTEIHRLKRRLRGCGEIVEDLANDEDGGQAQPTAPHAFPWVPHPPKPYVERPAVERKLFEVYLARAASITSSAGCSPRIQRFSQANCEQFCL